MPYAQSNNTRIYYEIHGQGPPLTLVEGIGYASWMWFRQIDPLASHHRLLIYDNRGVGLSDHPDQSYTIRDMADDLAGLLDAVGISCTHLLGVSMGGFIAQEFAIAYPERLHRLALASTAFGGPKMVPIPSETQQSMIPDPSLPPEERIRKVMSLAFAPGYAETHPEIVDTVLGMRLKALQPYDAWQRQAGAIANFDLSDRLSQLLTPTLILHGDADRVVPVENAHLLAEQLPYAKLTILPGGGHLVFIEQAERFNQAVMDFLR